MRKYNEISRRGFLRSAVLAGTGICASERQEVAGQAGYCTAKVQNCNFCKRLLLARTRKLQIL